MVCLRSAVSLALSAFASIASAAMVKVVRTGSADAGLAKRTTSIINTVNTTKKLVETYTNDVVQLLSTPGTSLNTIELYSNVPVQACRVSSTDPFSPRNTGSQLTVSLRNHQGLLEEFGVFTSADAAGVVVADVATVVAELLEEVNTLGVSLGGAVDNFAGLDAFLATVETYLSDTLPSILTLLDALLSGLISDVAGELTDTSGLALIPGVLSTLGL